jgi:mycothiol synthase
MPPITPWKRSDIAALVRLVDLTLPGERLTEDELVTACFDDPDRSVVLGPADGTAAIAMVARPVGRDGAASVDVAVAFVQLLAVAPARQGLGMGRALLAAAEKWAGADAGCRSVVVGAAAPSYLWPGIDVRWTAALALFEAAGYAEQGAVLNMSCPTTYRADPPLGITIGRVLEDVDGEAAAQLCRRHWPLWEAELRRAVDHGACFLARADAGAHADAGGGADGGGDPGAADAIGFACHSVNRVGWVGPLATVADHRHRGVGAALLSALCADLRVAGLPEAEISWVGPVGFYARTAGASVSRVFRQAVKPLADPAVGPALKRSALRRPAGGRAAGGSQ